MTDGVSVDNLADDESIPAESVSSVEPKSGRNRKKEGRLGNREYFQIVEGVNALQRAVAGRGAGGGGDGEWAGDGDGASAERGGTDSFSGGGERGGVAGVSGSVARSCEVFEWLGCLLVR